MKPPSTQSKGRSFAKAQRDSQRALEVDWDQRGDWDWDEVGEQLVLDESTRDINPEELREFLAADLLADSADPEFKERLRVQLWNYVRSRFRPDKNER